MHTGASLPYLSMGNQGNVTKLDTRRTRSAGARGQVLSLTRSLWADWTPGTGLNADCWTVGQALQIDPRTVPQAYQESRGAFGRRGEWARRGERGGRHISSRPKKTIGVSPATC